MRFSSKAQLNEARSSSSDNDVFSRKTVFSLPYPQQPRIFLTCLDFLPQPSNHTSILDFFFPSKKSTPFAHAVGNPSASFESFLQKCKHSLSLTVKSHNLQHVLDVLSQRVLRFSLKVHLVGGITEPQVCFRQIQEPNSSASIMGCFEVQVCAKRVYRCYISTWTTAQARSKSYFCRKHILTTTYWKTD